MLSRSYSKTDICRHKPNKILTPLAKKLVNIKETSKNTSQFSLEIH